MTQVTAKIHTGTVLFQSQYRLQLRVLTFLKSPAVDSRVTEGLLGGEVDRGSHGHIQAVAMGMERGKEI